jgi:hypothetical protein
MRYVLLATAALLAAAAIPGAPANAQSMGRSGFTASPQFHGDFNHNGGQRHDGQHRRFNQSVVLDNWGYYDSDINRSWEPDSFNDWWHDQPWRSYPRWMQSGSCDRIWSGGGQWRCSW